MGRAAEDSVFDGEAFNARLFFPRPDDGPPPPGADDRLVEVDGARLHLRVHPAGVDIRCTVLLFHGNGEVVPDYDAAAAAFAAAGARLAVVDYRGYGRSTGAPTLRNIIGDAPRVVDALEAALPASPLVVMGRSLGSLPIAPIYAAPGRAIGFIWESGVVELEGLLTRRGMRVPARFSDAERDAFDPLPKLVAGGSPVLVLHGDRDDVIDPREARRAYDAAGTEHKHLVLVPGCGHNDVMGSEIYWTAIAAFVAELRI